MSRARHEQGFTLIEVMTVVALIGILAGLSAPSFIRMLRRSQLGGEMRELYAGYLEAQGLAMEKSTDHCLALNQTGRSWEIKADTDGNTANGCEALVRARTLGHDHVGFGPSGGYPVAPPAPYASIAARDAWCTPCDDDSDGNDALGSLQFQSDGRLRNLPGVGTVVLYDRTNTVPTVEALLFVGPTGEVKMFRSN